MNGIIITALICGTVIMISLIDKIGKNKCKSCKHIKNTCVFGCVSNDAKKEIAVDIESLFR